MVRTFK